MFEQILKSSNIVQFFTRISLLFEASKCFNWLVGAGRFQDLYYFRHSRFLFLISRLVAFFFSPFRYFTQRVRNWTKLSETRRCSETVTNDFVRRPVSLLAVASLSMILANTLARYFVDTPPSWRGLLLRLAMIALTVPFLFVQTSWETLSNNSCLLKNLRKIFSE